VTPDRHPDIPAGCVVVLLRRAPWPLPRGTGYTAPAGVTGQPRQDPSQRRPRGRAAAAHGRDLRVADDCPGGSLVRPQASGACPRAAPTRRSPSSCTSASAPSGPIWTGSATRPAAAAAPTWPVWPSAKAWS